MFITRERIVHVHVLNLDGLSVLFKNSDIHCNINALSINASLKTLGRFQTPSSFPLTAIDHELIHLFCSFKCPCKFMVVFPTYPVHLLCSPLKVNKSQINNDKKNFGCTKWLAVSSHFYVSLGAVSSDLENASIELGLRCAAILLRGFDRLGVTKNASILKQLKSSVSKFNMHNTEDPTDRMIWDCEHLRG